MDVFKLDQTLAAGLGGAPPPEKLTPDVSFNAGHTEEFNLSFFDDTTTDTAGSESHDPPPQGFGGDESCTAMDSRASSPAAAFHDVHVPSPSSTVAYRQPVTYVHAATAPPPPSLTPPMTAVMNAVTSSTSPAVQQAPPGQSRTRSVSLKRQRLLRALSLPTPYYTSLVFYSPLANTTCLAFHPGMLVFGRLRREIRFKVRALRLKTIQTNTRLYDCCAKNLYTVDIIIIGVLSNTSVDRYTRIYFCTICYVIR